MPEFVDFTLLSAHSMSADVSSAAQDTRRYVYYAMQFTWTGSPVGNVSVQGSVDQSTWTDITGTVTACGGSSGNLLVNTTAAIGLPYIRAHYAFTSGTGALTVNVCTKTGA